MPLHFKTGDLLKSDCHGLVNPVNCIGVAGAGLALQFRNRWPRQVAEYTAFCQTGKMKPGVVHNAALPDGRRILSVPTKVHWRDQSLIENVALGIQGLVKYCQATAIPSVAVPPLGCGLGGLQQHLVLNLIRLNMADLGTEVHLYGFKDAS